MLCSTLRSAARARGSALPRPLSSLALKVYGGKQASPAAAATFAAWHECLDGVLYNGTDSSKAMLGPPRGKKSAKKFQVKVKTRKAIPNMCK